MGFEFLARILRATVAVTALVALACVAVWGGRVGLAVAVGSAWSICNLWLIERTVRLLGTTGRTSEPLRLMFVLGIKGPVLYGLGWWLLAQAKLPAIGLVGGFGLVFAVATAKALGLWLTQSETRTKAVTLVAAGALVLFAGLGAGNATIAQAKEVPTSVASAPGAPKQTVHGAGVATEGEAEPAEKHEKSGAPELPNFVTYLEAAFEGKEHPAWLTFVKQWENVLYALFAAIVLIVIFGNAAKPKELVPRGAQNAAEALLGGLHDYFLAILGPEGKPYVPFIGSLFLYIVTMNWMGMVPFLKSPNTSLNTTFALALCVFVYVQYIGITKNGLLGYLHHFAGQPKDAVGWGSAILLFPLEIMGEFIKPISLSCRLFGNILGEDILLAVFVGLGVTTLAGVHSPIGLPLQLPFLALSALFGLIQGLVFALLTTVYIVMMLPHGEHHEDHTGDHEAVAHP